MHLRDVGAGPGAPGLPLQVEAHLRHPRIVEALDSVTRAGAVEELGVGTRVERTEEAMLRLEEMIKANVPEAVTLITQGGGGGNQGQNNQSNRGQIRIMLTPRDQRERTNDQIATDLRRQLTGLPGVTVRAQASGGNFQLNRLLGGGGGNQGGGRLSLEIRGHDLDDARRLAQDVRAMMEGTPGIADVQVGRDEGRPELAIRVDRPKAAMLGMTVQSVATTIQTNVQGTTAAQFRERGNEYPVVGRL
jgi:HAE1 family hydrophobic/amphiphilic exporter-1